MAHEIADMAADEVESVLRAVAARIEPTAAQFRAAETSHLHLRELLDGGQIGSRIVGSYLSGSYARSTAIAPIDDVDIIFVIDPTYWKAGFFDSRPSPEKVLNSFAGAIRYRYPLSSVYGQRRSVGLELHHLHIDVVPAISLGEKDFILVPDRDANDWVRSAPRQHERVAKAVDQLHGHRFKTLVKLLKLWNGNLPASAGCKSFMIETMAIRVFKETAFESLSEGLVLFWDFAASRYNDSEFDWPDDFGMSFNMWTINVPDIAGTGSNVAASVDEARARSFSAKARISRDTLLQARRARTKIMRDETVRRALRTV